MGHPSGRAARGRVRLQSRSQADSGPVVRAVSVLPPDRGGVRLSQPRIRGLGGRRRHRHTCNPSRRGRDQDRDRLDGQGRLPARLRQRQPDDDPARRLRRPGLHARSRRGALRHPARPDSGLHRLEGRHVGQHSGDPRHRRQDRGPADRPVRLARRSDRACRRALARPAQEHHRARGSGAPVQGTRDDATRSRSRLRSCPARAPAARPVGAARDVSALRVPQPARARRHPRRSRAGATDARAGNRGRVARGRAAGSARPRVAGDPRRRVRARTGRRRHRRPTGRQASSAGSTTQSWWRTTSRPCRG